MNITKVLIKGINRRRNWFPNLPNSKDPRASPLADPWWTLKSAVPVDRWAGTSVVCSTRW